MINKKFKYFNNSSQNLNVELYSNFPSMVCIKTTALTIPPNGFEFVKFIILAPSTPCIIDAKILVLNASTKSPEELILFRITID